MSEKSDDAPLNTADSDTKRKTKTDSDKDYKRKHKNDSDSENHKTHKRSKRRDDERDYDSKYRRRRYKDLDQPQENYPRYYGDDEDKSRKNDRSPERHDVGSRYYGEGVSPKKDKKEPEVSKEIITPRQRKTVDLLTSKTGGAYIPPAKLRMMQAEITDKSSAAYQRIAWEALKKSIHGFINKVNTGNIGLITRDLLRENIVRGRGLLCKSLIQAQAASPTFTHVYAALVAVINSKFPSIGELLLRRLVLQFKRGFKRNDKTICISASAFVAHLVNQRVAHEILALEILTLLVETPTDDSVEVAIAFLKECGQKLTEVSSKGTNAIFEMLRNILHEGQLEKRIQYMIEVMFQVRKDGFKDHAAVIEELDIVEEEDQFTHLITLDKVTTGEDILNVFKFDNEYEENEGKYKTLSKEILGSDASGSDASGSEESGDSSEDEDDEEEKEGDKIIDNTETNLIALRRTIYLTIHSSLDFEECAHKLMKMQLKPGQEMELCHMFLDCCAEQRTYEKFYGLLAQRFCQINKVYVEPFQQIFKDTFATTHRLDTNRLRNVSKFFAHLLFTDAISWEVLEIMKLNEEDTTSSSRIFIKILFQELCEYMGLAKLNNRLKDPTLQGSFAGLFPRDNPKNTRFAINFFTSIGLGGLTDELREHMKAVAKMATVTVDKSSSSSSSSSSDSSSSSSSDSESSSSEDEKKKRKKKTKTKKRKSKNGEEVLEKRKPEEKRRNDEQKQKREFENGRNREAKNRRNEEPVEYFEERRKNYEERTRNYAERNRNEERNKNFEERSRNYEDRNEERSRNYENKNEDRNRNREGGNYEDRNEERSRNREGRNNEERNRNREGRNYEEKNRSYEERSKNYEEKVKNYDDKRRNYDERFKNYEEKDKNYEEKVKNYDDKRRNYEERSKNYEEKDKNFEDKRKYYDEKPRKYEEKSRYREGRKEEWNENREEGSKLSDKHSRSRK